MKLNRRKILLISIFSILFSGIITLTSIEVDQSSSWKNEGTFLDEKKRTLQQNEEKNIEIPKWQCPCLNDGICYTPNSDQLDIENPSSIFCNCTLSFIGQKCEQKAQEFSINEDIYQIIKLTKYKYFYYQPLLQSTQSFQLQVCFSYTNLEKVHFNQSQIEKSITFFLVTENLDGTLQLDERQNQPETFSLSQNQCKHIVADYTTFYLTKAAQMQRLVLAIKLGSRLYTQASDKSSSLPHNNPIMLPSEKTKVLQSDNNVISPSDTPKSPIKPIRTSLKYIINSEPADKNFYKLIYQPSYPHGHKKYSKQFLQKTLNPLTTRLIYLNFQIHTFSVDAVLQTIVQSIATIASFIFVAFILLIITTRILGISISQSFSSNAGLQNDIYHFERYMPQESYRRQQNQIEGTMVEKNEDECAICLVVFEQGNQVRKTPCDHIFHKSCIDSWCRQNLTCPVCRKSLTLKNLKQHDIPSLFQLRTNSDSND